MQAIGFEVIATAKLIGDLGRGRPGSSCAFGVGTRLARQGEPEGRGTAIAGERWPNTVRGTQKLREITI